MFNVLLRNFYKNSKPTIRIQHPIKHEQWNKYKLCTALIIIYSWPRPLTGHLAESLFFNLTQSFNPHKMELVLCIPHPGDGGTE